MSRTYGTKGARRAKGKARKKARETARMARRERPEIPAGEWDRRAL